MPDTSYFPHLLSSSTNQNTTHRYIYLAATLAAAVFGYSAIANNYNNTNINQTNNKNQNTSLTTSDMTESTATAASTIHPTHINGVPCVLHEIGDVMHYLFFQMRDLVCEKSVTRVDIVGKYRRIFSKKKEDHVVCSPLIIGSGGEDEWDNMEAVFSYMMCGYSVAWMWDVLKQLLGGKNLISLAATFFLAELFSLFVPF